jgi:flagellar basal body-associated protein FliL
VKLPIPRGRRAILALGVPLGLAAAGAFVFTTMSAAPKAPPVIPDPGQGQLGPMLVLDDKVINLTTATAGGYKYAKLGVTIEIRPSSASFYDLHGADRTKQETTELAKYTDQVPLLIDAVGMAVSSHDSASLTTADGRAKLKDELLVAAKKVLGDNVAIAVFFTNFVMQ